MSVDYDHGSLFGERYEDVYDHFGDPVYSGCCGVYMVWDPINEEYICPKCGHVYSRKEFLDEYVEAYGPECYGCRTNFPECIVCHRGHQQKLDERESLI